MGCSASAHIKLPTCLAFTEYENRKENVTSKNGTAAYPIWRWAIFANEPVRILSRSFFLPGRGLKVGCWGLRVGVTAGALVVGPV